MNDQEKDKKDFEEFRDSDFSFIGILTILIAYLTSRLIMVIIKEVVVLNLDATLLIQIIIYFSIIVFILKYYYIKKYKEVP